MSGLPWYKCFPRDFNDGMVGLTLEERGAYVTILNVIYAKGAPIDDDPGYFKALLCCSAKTWTKVRAALVVKRKLFEVVFNAQPCLMNRRAASEIANSEEKSEKFSTAGRKGGLQTQSNIKENNEIGQATLEPALTNIDTDTDTDAEVDKKEDANASLVVSAKPKPTPAVDEQFEAVWKAYPHRRGRSSKPKSLTAWRALPKFDRERLLPAVERYAREGLEPKAECGAKAFELWLRDQRFLDWLEEHPPPYELSQAEKDAHDAKILGQVHDLTETIARNSHFPAARRDGEGLRSGVRG